MKVKRRKEREKERETKMGTTGTKVNHDENKILLWDVA